MFQIELTKELLANIANFHFDNHDTYRYGIPSYKKNLLSRLKYWGVKILLRFGFVYFRDGAQDFKKQQAALAAHAAGLEELYAMLENKESKSLLVKLIAYYILGKYKVKLPLNTAQYWKSLKDLDSMSDKSKSLKVPNWNQTLYFFDLSKLNLPIKLYFTSKGIMNDFVVKQYEYPVADKYIIRADPGDVVIDAGGCYGDTALYFADRVGNKGHVYVFEFIPSNVQMAKKNLDNNQDLRSIITLVENPLWNEPDLPLYFMDKALVAGLLLIR
jgi:hypothetical protein